MRPKLAQNIVAAAVVAVLSAVIAGCGGDGSIGPPDATALTLDKTVITNAEVERRAAFLATVPDPTTGEVTAPDTGSDAYWELRRTAADQLRRQAAMGILANRCGTPCRVTKAAVTEQVDAIQKEQFNGSKAEFDAALKERGISLEDLREQILASLREEKLTEQQQKGVTFTEAQAQAYYSKNIAQYTTPAEKRLSHILVATKAVAQQLRPQLSTANFASVAKSRSLDAAAKTTGGDLGAVNAAGLIPELAAAASTLKVGAISQPIESQFGWHLLSVSNVPARTKPFSEVRGSILQEQLQIAQVAKVEKWRTNVLDKLTASATFVNTKLAPPPAPTPTTTAATTTAATTPATTSTP